MESAIFIAPNIKHSGSLSARALGLPLNLLNTKNREINRKFLELLI